MKISTANALSNSNQNHETANSKSKTQQNHNDQFILDLQNDVLSFSANQGIQNGIFSVNVLPQFEVNHQSYHEYGFAIDANLNMQKQDLITYLKNNVHKFIIPRLDYIQNDDFHFEISPKKQSALDLLSHIKCELEFVPSADFSNVKVYVNAPIGKMKIEVCEIQLQSLSDGRTNLSIHFGIQNAALREFAKPVFSEEDWYQGMLHILKELRKI